MNPIMCFLITPFIEPLKKKQISVRVEKQSSTLKI